MANFHTHTQIIFFFLDVVCVVWSTWSDMKGALSENRMRVIKKKKKNGNNRIEINAKVLLTVYSLHPQLLPLGSICKEPFTIVSPL